MTSAFNDERWQAAGRQGILVYYVYVWYDSSNSKASKYQDVSLDCCRTRGRIGHPPSAILGHHCLPVVSQYTHWSLTPQLLPNLWLPNLWQYLAMQTSWLEAAQVIPIQGVNAIQSQLAYLMKINVHMEQRMLDMVVHQALLRSPSLARVSTQWVWHK